MTQTDTPCRPQDLGESYCGPTNFASATANKFVEEGYEIQ